MHSSMSMVTTPALLGLSRLRLELLRDGCVGVWYFTASGNFIYAAHDNCLYYLSFTLIYGCTHFLLNSNPFKCDPQCLTA
jgi:hypothetical protein